MYELINNKSTFNSLSVRMKENCGSTYTEERVKRGIKDALEYAWTYAKTLEDLANFNHSSSDEDSDDSDEDDGTPYTNQRGPEYPECMYEIRGNYRTLCEFLVFTQSIPPIDMGLRGRELYNNSNIACFCPFGKDIRSIKNWFPDEEPSYINFLEKKCGKSKFGTYKALLSHCDDSRDWYHKVYAAFLRGSYCLPAKPAVKFKDMQICSSSSR